MKRKLSSQMIALKNEVYHATQRMRACRAADRLHRLYDAVGRAELRIKSIRMELEYNLYENEFLFPLAKQDK